MKKQNVTRLLALVLAAVMLVSLCSCQLMQNAYSQGSYTPPQPEVEPDSTQQVLQYGEYEMTLQLLMERLNSRRSESNQPEYELEDYLPDYESADFQAAEFSDDEFAMLTTQPTNVPDILTLEQAIEDVEYLFRILRTSYGAYTLFGGDEVFNAAKDKLIKKLETFYFGGITVDQLRSEMLDVLSFVEDTHFGIDDQGTNFNEKRYYRDSNELVFRYDDNGFYANPDNDPNGERWYISEEDEALLQMTIADDGELVYGLFRLDNQYYPQDLPESIKMQNAEGKTTTYKIKWSLMSCGYVWNEEYYTYDEVDGIPVVSLNTYYLDEMSFEDINDYLNDAEELRGEDVIIVDLRYNTGGYDSLNAMWLYTLTGGEDIDWSVGYAAYVSKLNNYVLTNNEAYVESLFDRLDFFDTYPEYWGESDSAAEEETYEVGDTYLIEAESDYYEYDGTIFVLFNKQTYSAGELALFQFENMSNVVFVGMNSNGCLLTGGTNIDAPVYLPNSGMMVNYSILLVTSDIMEGFDAYGFQPDIIVENENAIEDVINCWNYYNEE